MGLEGVRLESSKKFGKEAASGVPGRGGGGLAGVWAEDRRAPVLFRSFDFHEGPASTLRLCLPWAIDLCFQPLLLLFPLPGMPFLTLSDKDIPIHLLSSSSGLFFWTVSLSAFSPPIPHHCGYLSVIVSIRPRRDPELRPRPPPSSSPLPHSSIFHTRTPGTHPIPGHRQLNPK